MPLIFARLSGAVASAITALALGDEQVEWALKRNRLLLVWRAQFGPFHQMPQMRFSHCRHGRLDE